MSAKSNRKNPIQILGIILFSAALITFTVALGMSGFKLDKEVLKAQVNNEYQYNFIEPYLDNLGSTEYPNSFKFMAAYAESLHSAQADILKDVETNLGLTTSDGEYWNTILKDDKIKSMKFAVAKASSIGPIREHRNTLAWLSFGLGILGAFLYILPKLRESSGIKNNHIYHSPLHSKGWLGITVGIYLVGFYVLLYFFPEHMVNWVLLVDPISTFLNGGAASQWFLYGFLYTICILVMGVRMIVKYRHNKYQIIRTGSVMFFQTSFAFLIPEIMALLNKPAVDLKNMWPLDYSFFFDYRLDKLTESGGLGLFLLFWGIALFTIGVPFITYFFGKRWYCSWVCGCGGLAETLGDPYRQLSDKRMKAWKIERWMIHSVLVFAVVMTIAVLYSYLPESGSLITKDRFIWTALALLIGATVWIFQQYKKKNGMPKTAFYVAAAVSVALFVIALLNGIVFSSSNVLYLDAYQLRSWYGFGIGAAFSGVVGVGFYPFMGNRVWCRFGCPLAAYLGLVQRFKSRFRITTNGGQCISCGNCSTYCEMGIDVRAYAQRGQDIVRSSCVGCGVCSAVCPRGVLRLENGPEVDERATEERAIHIDLEGVRLLD
ncbi:MAG: 4Fe-4S binding protein [Saprospiraceae bacterium]|nr:4Fe-4S binding protein [Saprospiraceae bacterium]